MTGQTAAEIPKRQLRQAEILLAYLLRYGVILSATVITCGIFLLLINPTHFGPQSSVMSGIENLLAGRLTPEFTPPLNWASFSSQLRILDPFAVGSLGLMLLILLPIMRVAMTVVFFLVERDYLYFFITAFVFGVLLTSLLFGNAL